MSRRLTLIAISLLALAGASASGSTQTTPLASFRPAHGWIVVQAGADNPSLVVAVTTPDAAAVHPVALFESFKKLSPRGILIWADTAGRRRKGFPPAKTWPPKLTNFRIDHGWEGQPAPNIQQRTWVRAVHGWDLDIRVFFATQQPSATLKTRAQAELRQLHLP